MRILLDECVPKRLKNGLIGHEVRTVPESGWASTRNGDLLRLAEGQFDVFLTVDRKLEHQQTLSSFAIAVVVLIAKTNTLTSLQPLVPQILEALPRARPGYAITVG